MPSHSEVIVTANIGRHRSPAFRAAAIRRVRRAWPDAAPIIGWQEIDESDTGNEHGYLRRHLPAYAWAGMGRMVPIGVPHDWRIMEQSVVRAHRGVPGVTPSRVIVEARLRHRRRAWLEYVHLNSHVVAGAHTVPGQSRELLRRRLWLEWWETMRRRVRDHVREGRLVVVTCDANHPRLGRVHAREQRLVHGGFNYVLAVTPADPPIRLTQQGHRAVWLGIDSHQAHGVRVRFSTA